MYASNQEVFNNKGYKLCRGRTHPAGGEFVPPHKFYKDKHGKLFSVCIPCRNVLMGRPAEAGQASWAEAGPVFHKLIKLLGNKSQVSLRLGRQRNYVHTLMERSKSVRRTTLIEAENLLAELTGAVPRFWKVGEPEVVQGSQLAPIVSEWVVKYLRERPDAYKSGGNVSNGFVGPIQWLANETGLNPRRIHGLNTAEFEYVPLSQADAILVAMGKQDCFHTGEVEIIPNPNWRYDWWIEYMRENGCG